MGRITFIGLLSLLANGANAQQLLRAQGPDIVNAQNQKVVLRGVNLGGWLLQESYILGTDSLNSQGRIQAALLRNLSPKQVQKFYRRYRARFVTKADVDFLADQGFNCVRLPLHYDLFLTPGQRLTRFRALQDPASITAYTDSLAAWYDRGQLFTGRKLEGFGYIDDVLRWCGARGLYVVLDLHAAPGGQGTDRNINDNLVPLDLWKRKDQRGRMVYQDATVRLWEQLAARYRTDTRVAMYDLINEPHNLNPANGLSADNQELRALYIRLLQAVRGQQDKHLVLLEGNGYGNEYTNLTPDKLPAELRPNLVYNAHRYWCSNSPSATDPNPNQINLLHNLAAFRDQHQVPVWVGETGENSNDWFITAVQGLNAENIGWCHWNLKRVDATSGLLQALPYGSILTASGRNQLLQNVEFKNCLINKDVVAALTQPADTRLPFTPLQIPGTIQATAYDMGRAGIAYQDTYAARVDYRNTAPVNQGGAYRNDGVDIERTPDQQSSGFVVSELQVGEWLRYTVTVAAAGTYTLQVRLKPATTAGRLTFRIDDAPIVTASVPPASSTPIWTTISLTTTPLSAGTHTLQIGVEQPVEQLSWLRFIPGSSATAVE